MVPAVRFEYGAGVLAPERGLRHAVRCANVPVVDEPNAIGVSGSPPPNCEDERGTLVVAFHSVVEVR